MVPKCPNAEAGGIPLNDAMYCTDTSYFRDARNFAVHFNGYFSDKSFRRSIYSVWQSLLTCPQSYFYHLLLSFMIPGAFVVSTV
jgi:hypothetical protein